MVVGMEVEVPFGGKVGLKDGKIVALVFEQGLTKKQLEYLTKWHKQYYPDLVRKYERSIKWQIQSPAKIGMI